MREWLTSLYRKLVMMRPATPAGRGYRMGWVDWLVSAVRIASIGVAVWMAVDVVPRWIELPALAVLWIVGIMYFVVLGVPLLILPLYFLWDAVWPGKAGRRADRQYQGQERPLTSKQSIRRSAIEMDSEPEENDTGVIWDRLESLLHVVAGIALFVTGRPVLAFVYLCPEAGLFLYNTIVRIRFGRLHRS